MQLITITEAASTANKSIQTIRRMIKQKKIQVKRQKTPQGFNYLIVKDSLLTAVAAINEAATHELPEEMTPEVDSTIHDVTATTQPMERDHRAITQELHDTFQAQFERFGATINTLIEQNTRDKDNFFQLIKTFQDRVITLENHIKLLEAPAAPWWKFWE